ncbi:MAG: hypothetical protein JSV76_06670 [Candidatus Bathyarchaeota archaeon]|nr:MAG: hypothetical protein JSV76_06670 [Candidatus Bathyarchaeota archaeon]
MITLFGPSVFHLRLLVILLYALSTIFVYKISAVLFNEAKHRQFLRFGSVVLFSLFFSHYISLEIKHFIEVFGITLCLASLTMLLQYYRIGKTRYLFYTGVLIACAILTTYRNIPFFGGLMISHIILLVKKRQYLTLLKSTTYVILGLILPFVILLAWLIHINVLPQFYTQTILYQYKVTGFIPLEAKFDSFITFIKSILPLLIPSLYGIGLTIKNGLRKGQYEKLVPIIIILVYIPLIILTKGFAHYYFTWLPFLMIFAILGCYQIVKRLVQNQMRRRFVALGIAVVVGISVFSVIELPKIVSSLQPRPYNQIHREIGLLVNDITEPSETIWTSEGAIPFFAQRLIEPPNSTDFPFHHAFEIIFLHRGGKSRVDHIVDPQFVILTIQQFIEAWEEKQVNVIILIRSSPPYDWVPYPDNLLWTGFDDQSGVAEYMLTNYDLHYEITNIKIPSIYQIWIRK